MPVDQNTLQSTLLRVLADPKTNKGLGGGREFLTEAVLSRFVDQPKPSAQQIMEGVWALVSQGLAYIDYHQPEAVYWELRLTEAGLGAAQDEAINPDDSGEYLVQLSQTVPAASELVLQYTQEAITTYKARCYLASTVMLGVASEAAFLEMAVEFASWLPTDTERNKMQDIMAGSRNYIVKFAEFRKRVEKYKSQIPDELSDGMALTLDSVLDLLRIYRNEASHPTGKKVTRQDAFINLQMFARYLHKLYALREYFESSRNNE